MRHAILCGVLTFACVGCVSEATRQLVNQSYQAGRSLGDDATLPAAAREKGRDIADNCVEVAQDVGSPKKPEPYSSKASAFFRRLARETRENRANFFSNVIGVVTNNIPWAATVMSLVTAAGLFWKKKNLGVVLESVIEGVEKVKAQMPATAQDDTNKILREVANKNCVYVAQKKALAKFKARKLA